MTLYVFRCRRIEDGTFVAIKKIAKIDDDDDDDDEDGLIHIEFTALSLAKQHDVPNVVQVLELLEGDETNSYLVLE